MMYNHGCDPIIVRHHLVDGVIIKRMYPQDCIDMMFDHGTPELDEAASIHRTDFAPQNDT